MSGQIKTINVSTEKLKNVAYKTFLHFGLNEEDALIAADVLNSADRRGIETHGLNRLKSYINSIKNGKINKKSELKVIKDSGSTILFDGDYALGLVSSTKAMKKAIERAKETGICLVGVKNGGHFGIAGYYSLMAAKENMIGISMSNSDKIVVPYGAKKSILGNSPWSIAFPGGNKHKDPVLVDMACSEVSFGRLQLAKRDNKEIPDTWGVDEEGNSTTDIDKIYRSQGLLPFGGVKGYAITLVIEMLVLTLTGSGYGEEIGLSRNDNSRENLGQIMIAIDPDKMIGIEGFKEEVDGYIDYIKSVETLDGVKEIRIPGERTFKSERKNEKEGIDFSLKLAEELLVFAKENNILNNDSTLDDLFNL